MGTGYIAYYFGKGGSLNINILIFIFLILGVWAHGSLINYAKTPTKEQRRPAALFCSFPSMPAF